MPEVRLHIRWPDGEEDYCYSPSSTIKEHFDEGNAYPLAEFMAKARLGLTAASNRVKMLYGYPCSAAKGQLQSLEVKAKTFENAENPIVTIIAFKD